MPSLAQPAHLVPHPGPARRVQAGGRLVQEHHLRLVDHAQRDVQPAALATGVGLASCGRRTRSARRPPSRPRPAAAPRPWPGRASGPATPVPGGRWSRRRCRRPARRSRSAAHRGRVGQQVGAGDGGLAAVRSHQGGQHPQRGRLAGPVRTEETEDLALVAPRNPRRAPPRPSGSSSAGRCGRSCAGRWPRSSNLPAAVGDSGSDDQAGGMDVCKLRLDYRLIRKWSMVLDRLRPEWLRRSGRAGRPG